MIVRSILLAGLLLGLIGAAPVRAAVVGDASVAYSATRIVTVDGRVYQGRVFHVPGKERQDLAINGIPISVILDLAAGKGLVVLPALNAYVEMPLPSLLAEFDRSRLAPMAVADARIEGIRAVEYHVDFTASDGTRGDGNIWLSHDNILLRLDGSIRQPRHKVMNVSMHLAALKLGRQGEDLFNINSGLTKIPYEALEVLMNLRTHKKR